MAFDPGVFAQAGKPTIPLQNPNEVLGQAAAAANAVNANRLFQAQTAAGQAAQSAIDPSTGLMSQNRLGANLAAMSPQFGIAIPQAIAQGQTQATAQQDIAAKQAGYLQSSITAALDMPDAQLHDYVAQAINRGVSMGLVPAATGTKIALQLSNDPAQLRTQLRQIQLGQQAPGAQQDQVYGTTGTVNTGGTLQPIVTPSAARGGGMQPAGGAMPLTVSPDAAVAPRTVLDANGNPITAPSSTFMPPAAVPPQLRGGQTGGAGRYPIPAGAPGAGGPAVPGAGGASFAGPAAGVPEMNQADVTQYRADLNDVPNATTRIQTLQNAQSALDQAMSGKGSAPVQTLLSVINTFAPDMAKKIGAADAAEQYDLAKKYLSDYARRSGAATHSDAQLAAAGASNASPDITNAAAQDVVKLQIGRERQRIAQAQAFGNPTGVGYGQHASQFSTGTDPRAFAWDTYTPAERQQIESTIRPGSDAEKKFNRSLGIAARLRLIQPPSAQ